MVTFLQQFGVELVLLLYGILTTILNIVTFRRTGKLVKPIADVVDNSSTSENKLVKKIEKAKSKLEKLINQATNGGEE